MRLVTKLVAVTDDDLRSEPISLNPTAACVKGPAPATSVAQEFPLMLRSMEPTLIEYVGIKIRLVIPTIEPGPRISSRPQNAKWRHC